MEKPILDVENLRIRYGGSASEAVRGISFTLGRERLGIVGESGLGKSTVGRALPRLLPSATITADRLDFEGLDLLSLSEREMLKVRGRRMSMILQDPKFSLNPISPRRRSGDGDLSAPLQGVEIAGAGKGAHHARRDENS